MKFAEGIGFSAEFNNENTNFFSPLGFNFIDQWVGACFWGACWLHTSNNSNCCASKYQHSPDRNRQCRRYGRGNTRPKLANASANHRRPHASPIADANRPPDDGPHCYA